MLYQGNILLTNEGGISESDLNLRLQDFENSLNIDAKLEEFKNSLDLGTVDNMFIATYGVTTNAEIEAAYNANKWIFAIYAGRLCPLATRSSATKHYFISNAGTGALQLTCLNNEWSYLTISYADSIHGSTHAPGGSDPITGYSKIVTGSYTGTGTYGASGPSSLTFDFEPKVIMLVGIRTTSSYMQYFGRHDATGQYAMFPHLLTSEYTVYQGFVMDDTGSSNAYAKRDGNTFYWYHRTNAVNQANTSGCTYYYVAIG